MNALKRWDIFCKIVDNFGDIGVCWRLARQLQVEHGVQIRLWIDDLEAAQEIIPHLNPEEKSQICEEITILKWQAQADFSQAAEVVIEAFACELPPAYLAAMARQQSKWVNLDYLSAETWVDDFHGKPSPQPNGLTRYFYFPGFSDATGGLIREAHIAVQLQSDINPRPQAGLAMTWLMSFVSLVRCLVVPSEGARQRGREAFASDSLKISLFCYSNAPIKDLLTALQANIHAAFVYVPASSILPQIADFFGVDTIGAGDYFTRGNLHVHILPFLSQADYDQLLVDCDVNFVRGEDSWVRAIWAGKPFIWQPYFQVENAHIMKLNAFLERFYTHLNIKQTVCEAHRCWAVEQLPKHVWNAYLEHLSAISNYTLQQSQQLAKQQDLAAKLVIFCNKL